MYKLWPRFTLFYAYLFEYQDVFLPVYYSVAAHEVELENTASPVSHYETPLPDLSNVFFLLKKLELTTHQVVVFGLEILSVPHYVVGLFAWHWLNLHPWICSAIMIHCVWATQSEAKKTLSYIFSATQVNWRLQFSRTVRYVGTYIQNPQVIIDCEIQIIFQKCFDIFLGCEWRIGRLAYYSFFCV